MLRSTLISETIQNLFFINIVNDQRSSSSKKYSDIPIAVQEKPVEKKNQSSYSERDLHPLVTRFVYANQHFKAHIKTIFHESSSNVKKGFNEWLHPDLVGAYLPFDDYDEVTLKLQKSLSMSSVKIFSFELKKELTFTNLRQYYFQAVSNSSWAHEGYLVIGNLAENSDLIDELWRLNNAFGIGLIKLNFESIDESEILFQSKLKQEMDWNTVNRLIEENQHFKRFMEDVEEDLQLRKIKGAYDKVLNEDDLTGYMAEKKNWSLGLIDTLSRTWMSSKRSANFHQNISNFYLNFSNTSVSIS